MEITVTCSKRQSKRLKVVSSDRAVLSSFVDRIPDGYYTMTIKPDSRYRRSIPQNSYYYGCVITIIRDEIARQWGEKMPVNATKSMVHELLRSKFLFYEIPKEDSGEIIRIPRSTTTLTKTEFNEYIELCRLWALENLGIDIPLPNSELEIDF